MKSVVARLSAFMLALAPIAANSLSTPAHADTAIGETTLTSDTVWTAEAGPYTLAGPVTIPEGVTLTIEPGATITGDVNTTFRAPLYTPWFTVLGNLDARGTESSPVRMLAETGPRRALVRGPFQAASPSTGRVSFDHVDLKTDDLTQYNAASNLAALTMSDSEWSFGSSLGGGTENLTGIDDISLTRNAIHGGPYSLSAFKFGTAGSRTTLIGNRLRASVVSCEAGAVTMRQNTLEAFPYRAVGFFNQAGSGLRTRCAIDARDNYWESGDDLANRIYDGNDSLGYAFADTTTRLDAPAPGTPTMSPGVMESGSGMQIRAEPTGLRAWLSGQSSDGGLPTISKMEAIASDTGKVEQTIEGSSSFAQFRNLDTSKSYFIRATRTNSKGTVTATSSSAVTPVPTATVPGTPASVQMSQGARSATFWWDRPATEGGTPIAYYQWLIEGPTVEGSGGLQQSVTFNGLVAGANYKFAVYAVNDMGSGEKVELSFKAATTPSPARIGIARSGAAGGKINATALWAAPTTNGGLPVSHYRVTAYRLRANGSVASTRVSPNVAPVARSYQMTLPVKGRYRLATTAYNQVGAAKISSRSNAVYGR